MTIDLGNIFDQIDVESLRTKALVERGIDIQGVYDLHTGRIIGYLEPDEIHFAADEIDYDSDDQLIDGLIERVVASMRPSICLNKPDRFTLQNLMTKRPVDCMAFLVNRLHAGRKTLIERGRDTIAPLHDRIVMYRRLSALDDAGVDLTPWLHWLLELDAKCNLHDVTPQLFAQDRLGKWIAVRDGGISVFWALNESNAADLLKLFESWVFKLLENYDQRETQARRESEWYRGNTHAQPAFVRSWLENPDLASRKAADRLKKEKAKAARPAKPMTEKAKARAESVKTALDQLEAILNSGQMPARPTPKPTLLKPNLGKLLGKLKQESN